MFVPPLKPVPIECKFWKSETLLDRVVQLKIRQTINWQRMGRYWTVKYRFQLENLSNDAER